MKQKEALYEASSLLDTYCDGCLLHSHYRQNKGKSAAHRFCIKSCTVGKQLQKCGKCLAE
jgi:hypothetical protein